MTDFLTQMFGANGLGVEQFIQIAAAAAVVIALVFWLGTRFWRTRTGGPARGRVPRLAIVDAMPIDSRRRLVLVRRDSVEHLILIGGPSDLVVEPSIARAKQRIAQPVMGQGSGALSAAPAVAAEAPVRVPTGVLAAITSQTADRSSAGAAGQDVPPIPFPFSRIPPAEPASRIGNGHAVADDQAPPSEFAPFAGWLPPQTGDVPILDARPDSTGAAAPPSRVGTPFAGESPGRLPALANGAGDRSNIGAGRYALPDSLNPALFEDGAAHKVSELEAEMNLLLGELSGDARSP